MLHSLYKLMHIGLGSPGAPQGPSKRQKAPKLAEPASKWTLSGYILLELLKSKLFQPRRHGIDE
jgi:hypothetical protein